MPNYSLFNFETVASKSSTKKSQTPTLKQLHVVKIKYEKREINNEQKKQRLKLLTVYKQLKYNKKSKTIKRLLVDLKKRVKDLNSKQHPKIFTVYFTVNGYTRILVDNSIKNAKSNIQYEIPYLRRYDRECEREETFVGRKIGGVYTSENSFLHYHKRSKIQVLMEDKTPKNKKNHIGIEIECLVACKLEALEQKFIEAGLEKHVQLKEDHSIHAQTINNCKNGCCECTENDNSCDCNCNCFDAYMPIEIVCIALEHEVRPLLKRVIRVLDSVKAKVNYSCGLHIHLDMRNRDPKVCYYNLVESLPFLRTLVPRSRYENNFCKHNYSSDLEDYPEENRYYAINANALKIHNTLEVRLHTGSTNFIKIIRWIELLLLITSSNLQAKDLSTLISLNPRLKNYIENRVLKFKLKKTVNEKINNHAILDLEGI